MDISVDPCEDFYHFSCGGWINKTLSNELDKNIIYSSRELDVKVKKDIQEIFESEYIVDENLSKEDQDYDEKVFKKLKSIYNTCKNKEINETYPNELLINFVNSLNISENKDKLKDKENFINLLAKLQTKGFSTFIDFKIITEPVITLTIPSKVMSSKIEYKIPSKLPETIPVVKEYIKNTFISIYGEKSNIDSIVDSIYETESKIINFSQEMMLLLVKSLIENQQTSILESYKLSELNEKYSMINLNSYIKNLFEFFNLGELIKDDMIIHIEYPMYFESIDQFINELSADDLVNYLEWKIITSDIFSDYVSGDFVKAEIEYNEKIDELVYSKLSMEEINELFDDGYSGIIDDLKNMEDNSQEQSSMNKRFFKYLQKRDDTQFEDEENIENNENENEMCVNSVSYIMPKAFSKYYIQKTFNENIRNEVKEMTKNIKEAMINTIKKAEWLDDETKEQAVQKVLKMEDRIGYSDDIMDPKKLYQLYKNLEVNNYFDFLIEDKVANLRGSFNVLDKNNWKKVDPQTVDAYYDFYFNTINIPAAFLQKPFFSINGPDYINYGLSGSIIGHEVNHAFDVVGRERDSEGNYNNWWTENDNEEYIEHSQCFIDQYNALTYEYNNQKITINGENTLVENLADNAGLPTAYDAWKLSLSKNSEKAAERNKKLPGFENYTIDQLFYISYGQISCNTKPYTMNDNNHSPKIARVNAVLSNSEHFAKTFNCPTKSTMNPNKKCVIW